MPGARWQETGAAIAVVSALAVVLFHAGTFHHGATTFSLAAGAVLLLVFALPGGGAIPDPLALRQGGPPWWPAFLGVFWLAVVLSWLLSPVGRAGEAIVLFLLPAAWASAGIGRLLRSASAVRWALAGLALVAVSASAWALATRPLHEQGRAALPIGHHNQLALVLVALLPPAVLGVWRAAGHERRRLRQGAVLFVAAVLVWTLAATGSMSGLLALGTQALAALAWITLRRRRRRLFGWRRRARGGVGRLANAVERHDTDSTRTVPRSVTQSPSAGASRERRSPACAPTKADGPRRASEQLEAGTAYPLSARRLLLLLGAGLALAVGLGLAVVRSVAGADLPGPLGRLGAVLRLEDPSLLARRTYAEAAVSGFLERPVLGWGPGSTAWTLANHWRPTPGIHPPGEVVTDAHSVLAQAPYELGVIGSALLLLLAVRWATVRLRDLGDPRTRDPALLAAALLGLLGAAVCMVFGVFAVVTAVPAVLILDLGLAAAASRRLAGAMAPTAGSASAGEAGDAARGRGQEPGSALDGATAQASHRAADAARLAGRGHAPGPPLSPAVPDEGVVAKRRFRGRWRQGGRIAFHLLFVLFLVAVLSWTWQRASAARAYEKAVGAETAVREAAAATASGGGHSALPPGPPRFGRDRAPVELERPGAPALVEIAALLRIAAAADPSFPLYQARLDPWAAAQAADGLAPLWLLAGLEPSLDLERRRVALERACDLDPLSALAPFELMRLEREAGAEASRPRVAARAARAILAEPLLLAAAAFEGDPDLRSEVHRGIRSWPGLPPGWLAAFEELWFGLDWSNGQEGLPRDELSVDADARPAVSFSLFAFRRPPWPLSIGAVPLRSHRLDFVAARDLPAVTRLPETAPEPFWTRRCGLD